MTRAIDQSKAKCYLTKAENSLRIAKLARQEGAHDTAVMDAVHSAINALDALTTFYRGKRSSGQHTDVLSLIKEILSNDEYAEVKKQFGALLSKKNESEYQPDLMVDKDSEKAITQAERILNRVKGKLK